MGRDPRSKIIQTTHTGELAVRFGRKAKNLIDSPEYQQIFKTRLQEDSKAAGRWETAQGGEYYAAGVGGAITGRGADLLIIDDPHSEQDALSPSALERGIRVVYIGTPSASPTRWGNRARDDPLVRQGFDRTPPSLPKGSEGGPMGRCRIPCHLAEQEKSVATVLECG